MIQPMLVLQVLLKIVIKHNLLNFRNITLLCFCFCLCLWCGAIRACDRAIFSIHVFSNIYFQITSNIFFFNIILYQSVLPSTLVNLYCFHKVWILLYFLWPDCPVSIKEGYTATLTLLLWKGKVSSFKKCST